MSPQNPPLPNLLKNLFPEAFQKAVTQIFGHQAIFPVLLGLLPAGSGSEQAQPEVGPADLLHPGEAAILGNYTFQKRRSEYLTGRVCAKLAVQGYLKRTGVEPAVAMPEIEITNETGGRPVIQLHNAKARPGTMDISISHSGDYGVALVAGRQCGIDLQEKKSSLIKVQDKYCIEDECMLLAAALSEHEPLTRLAMLWAAKEAAKKALSDQQIPGFLDLKLNDLQPIPNCSPLVLHLTHEKKQQPRKEVRVVAGMFHDYALAICLISKENDAGTARS